MNKAALQLLLTTLIITLLIPLSPALAHSGGTDENGGHYQSGVGYHYHHGYPAHKHTGGVCPYDFKDNTNHGSSGSSSSSNNTSTHQANKHPIIEKIEYVSGIIGNIIATAFLLLILFMIATDAIQYIPYSPQDCIDKIKQFLKRQFFKH